MNWSVESTQTDYYTYAILWITIMSFCLAMLYFRVNWILPSFASPAKDDTLGFLRINPGESCRIDGVRGIADTPEEYSALITPSTLSLVDIASSNAAEVVLLTELWTDSFDGRLLKGLSGTIKYNAILLDFPSSLKKYVFFFHLLMLETVDSCRSIFLFILWTSSSSSSSEVTSGNPFFKI